MSAVRRLLASPSRLVRSLGESTREMGIEDGPGSLYAALLAKGMSRRSFLRFATAMTAALALPSAYGPRIAAAVQATPRLPLIWLRGQDCGGDTVAFTRAAKPTAVELILETLSLEYHESLMASSGATAEDALVVARRAHPDGYIAVVEGSVPTAAGGAYCLVGGRPFADIVREVTGGALATIAVGACAFDGGAPGAAGGVTGASPVESVMEGSTLINLPGCPVNVENLAATIVHYITFKEFPVTDSRRRPLFAYGGLIHNQCERRAHFEFGEFSTAWGDEGAQRGWCLYKMGCKGPETYANCPTTRYAEGTSWPVKAGHGCIGCHSPRFWDVVGDAYLRLPSPVPFAPSVTADQVGGLLVGGVGALTVVHAGAMYAVQKRRAAADLREASRLRAAAAGPAVGAEPALAATAAAHGAPETGAHGGPAPGLLPEAAAEAVAPVPEPVAPEAAAEPVAPEVGAETGPVPPEAAAELASLPHEGSGRGAGAADSEAAVADTEPPADPPEDAR